MPTSFTSSYRSPIYSLSEIFDTQNKPTTATIASDNFVSPPSTKTVGTTRPAALNSTQPSRDLPRTKAPKAGLSTLTSDSDWEDATRNESIIVEGNGQQTLRDNLLRKAITRSKSQSIIDAPTNRASFHSLLFFHLLRPTLNITT